MLAAGFLPDVISSDVHALSINGPAFDQLVTMSKFLCLGMALTDVIGASTAAPAAALGRTDIGSLEIGAVGDATVLELAEGEFEYRDVLGEVRAGRQRLKARRTCGGRTLVAPAAGLTVARRRRGVACGLGPPLLASRRLRRSALDMVGNFIAGLGRDIRGAGKKGLEVLGSSFPSLALEEVRCYFNCTDLLRDRSGNPLIERYPIFLCEPRRRCLDRGGQL